MILQEHGTPEQIKAALRAIIVTVGLVKGVVSSLDVAGPLQALYTEESLREYGLRLGAECTCPICTVNAWIRRYGAESGLTLMGEVPINDVVHQARMLARKIVEN